ncbi:MAG: PilT/PilU family type 4a pilus ATPase [Lachnospiraceae bacterium]|nr:PilT/PilU family type 4a pilus ATPase [Lachnospiraceae bacterium]
MGFVDIIEEAKAQKASDVHITVGTAMAFRKFGKLEILSPAPTAEESEDLILEGLTEKQRQKVLNGEDLDFAMMIGGTRLRANIYHQRNNLAATYRILQDRIPTFDELNLPEAARKLINEPRGLVLITGPTGSGKTTTLASMIDYVNKKQAKHVMTIEDPIEYVYYHAKSMIHQREVGKDVDTFATALRSSLREDPDIILVGEMRDYETISAAITAAETGHLVLSTLHTTSAPQTIERIIDAYPHHGQSQARTQLANVLKGIVTQQLIPRDDGEGMAIATEILINTEAIANQIRENKTHQIISSMQGSYSLGMHTMNSDLRRLVKEQKITNTTALKYCSNVKDFENLR